MNLEEVESAAKLEHLHVLGAFHAEKADQAPPHARTLILLGPGEPGFWRHATAAPEFTDGRGDPLDRWSKRVISALAGKFDAEPLFPFGGPPYQPFFKWALRTGRCWPSPISFLIHDEAGLFVSFRGALAMRERLEIPLPSARRPCETCSERPCIDACPADVLDDTGYDAIGCKEYVASPAGADCLRMGCAARRSCPVSKGYGRVHAQSRFHQQAFLER